MENLFSHSCPCPGAPSEEAANHTHMSAAVSFRHTHTHPTRAGGETRTPANRLPFRQDKGKHETDEGGRLASCMYLLAPATVTR